MTSPRKISVPNMRVAHVILPKRGHNLEECEDAFAWDLTTNRFAIADGATEAFDSGAWARRLVTNWVNEPGLLDAEPFWTWLEKEGQAQTDAWSRIELPWYSVEKSRVGSFAAFVGLEIQLQSEIPLWTAVALGDSCLIYSRDGDTHAFPLSHSSDFGSAPVLAPSRTAVNAHARSAIVTGSGALHSGDKLLLLTDAAAVWYLRICEEKDNRTRLDFEDLLALKNNQSPISNFLEQERSTGRLKDDDIAIVSIEF